MKTSRLLVAGMMVVFALAAGIRAEEDEKQDRAKLLIGTWKVTTADRDAPLGIGDTTEFSKDGKNRTTRRKAGKEVVSQGTYKFEKGKLVITFKSEKGVSENVLTIKMITDKELILSHDEGGKVIEFRKELPPAATRPQNTMPRLYGGLPRFSPGRFYHGAMPPGR
jgi:uncharacterized protein (TIGR03066 family)